ncbi:MAG: PTS sugar transporter subunit IIA [Planctomycetes bacterium]|nr:PTS sugar transporter subunit IIA [Planctomycetota bacterium]
MKSSDSRRIPFFGSFLSEDLILLDAPATSMEEVVQAFSERMLAQGLLKEESRAAFQEAILAREKKSSTAIGLGVAVPHAYTEFLSRPVVLLARLAKPIDLGAPDDLPTDLVFLLAGHEGDQATHLETLMQLSQLLQQDGFCAKIRGAETPADLLNVAEVATDELRTQHTPKDPVGSLSRQGIEARTGRFAGGLIDDVRRRLPHYLDDFKQGLQPKTLAATVFLFFACFTGALTFGAIMADGTGGAIGVSEMIMVTAVGGVLFAIFGGQPLIVLGGVGPVLIFTTILYSQTQSLDLPFLPTYAWIGLWAGLFTVVLAVTDASVWLRYVSRFTDEVFVVLTAFIFIEKAIRLLADTFVTHEYATALSTVVLAVGTFGIAVVLRDFRSRTYLRDWARNFLADFGTVIAIGLMAWLAWTMKTSTNLDHVKLSVSGLSLSLVDLTALSPGWVLICAMPGAFLAILIFLCQQITGRVCNSPELNLTKGPGYHLDLFVVGVLLFVSSLFGLPWLVAATVRSLNHVQALSSSHAVDSPDGGHTQVDRVVENRVSAIAIHVLIACSLFLAPFLEHVPMACLFGIFLYMGYVSFSGNQLFQRLTLWVQDPKLYPPTHYLRRVPTKTVHAFTAIQFCCLAVLCGVQYSPLALFFPLILALLIPVRLLLDRVYDPEHMATLDAEETVEDELEHWI